MTQDPSCQSCSMTSEEHFGTEPGGSKSKGTYCCKFTQPEITVEGMADYLTENLRKWTQRPDLNEEKSRGMILSTLGI